ncbi:MAG: nucleotide exchange factor GrpE [Candidatus Riflebacteria bacterium HGW-Riflebacteria-1]|jgi:molecular chaperone GrpE|nr:MAG: nucleotide exchange factor GrpE [Candidatus Riflebacteria bacterium HGW-Riflebacteria-1]
MMQKDVKAEGADPNESEANAEDLNGVESGEDAGDSEKAGDTAQSAAEEPGAGNNLAKELDDMKHRYYRALADYQNLQRRTAKEVLEARGRGVEDFLKNLLPVIDTLDKAMEQISKSNIDKKIADGLEMFSIQFSDMLSKEGLKEINPIGKPFDPHFHEAMCKRCVEDQDDEIVLAEFEKGYMFKERVLRTAKVEINQK